MRAWLALAAIAAAGCPGSRGAGSGATASSPDACDASTVVAESRALRADGYLGRALRAAERADGACPGPDTAVLVAETLADLGLTERALIAYERVVAIGTDADRAAAAAAVAELRARPPAVADASDEDRLTALALYRDGVSLRLAGDHAQSLRQLRRSYGLSPHPLTIVQIGVTHEAAGDAIEARRAFARALAIAEDIAGEPAQPIVDTGHAERVQAVAYDAAGQLVATGGNEGVVKVWGASTGAQVWSQLVSDAGVLGVAFRDDGALVTVSEGGLVAAWNIVEGTRLSEHYLDFADEVAVRSDGALVVGAGEQSVQVVDTRTGDRTALRGAHRGVSCVAFGAGGAIAAGSVDGSVAVWPTGAGDARIVQAMADPVLRLAVDADGSRIAAHTGEPGQPVAMWHVVGTLHLPDIPGGVGRVNDLAFSPDGAQLAVVGQGELIVHDTATGAVRADLAADDFYFRAVAFSPDGTRVTAGTTARIARIWELATGAILHTLGGAGDAAMSVAVDPDSRQLAVAGKVISLWSWTGEEVSLRLLEGHRDWVFALAFADGGARLLSGGEEGTLVWWDTSTGARARSSDNQDANDITGLSVSRDARYVVTSGRHVRVYEVATGALVHEVVGSGAYAAFHPRADVLVVTDEDAADVLSVPGWERTGGFRGDDYLEQVVFVGDDMAFTLGGHPTLWRWTSGESLATLPRTGSETLAVVASADEQLVAAGFEGGIARVWSVADRALVHTLDAGASFVTGVAFLDSGDLIATTIEGLIGIWDPVTGERLATLASSAGGDWVIATTDGRVDGSPGAADLVTYRAGRVGLPGFVGWQRDATPHLLAATLGFTGGS